MDDFNFELLRIFLVVSKLHSFSRAADYLYVDQSTISKKMRQLEDEFGLTLFVRTARGVELTVAGTSFKQRAQQLIDDFEHLREKSPVEWKNLLIGVFDNIAAYCYPGFFARHLAEFKLLKVGNAGVNLIDLFNSGELDIVIVNGSLGTLTGINAWSMYHWTGVTAAAVVLLLLALLNYYWQGVPATLGE